MKHMHAKNIWKVSEKRDDMYQAGIYCRVSIKEEHKENEYSNSIHSQIQMARDYINNKDDIEEKKVYVDDGVSGSHFERAEFRRMLADIELGVINMVIFKDISRLGREQIDTNYYLGKYFPDRQIRVISILDYYDSAESVFDEMLEIKTLLNDMYLRDTSKKIKTSIQSKRSMGEYTSKHAPFGYVPSQEKTNHLEVDPYAANIVKRIFRMYQDGLGYTAIARILNEEGIPSPAKYKKDVLKTNYTWKVGKGLWSLSAVSQILKNPVYTGAVVIRKFDRPFYKLKYRKAISLEEMELVPNAHAAIISKEEFDQVQSTRQGRQVPYLDGEHKPHKYAGLLFCGKCKAAMRKRYLVSRNDYDGYVCGFHQKMGSGYCELNHITFEKLDELVVFAINQQLNQLKIDIENLKDQIIHKKPDLNRVIAGLQKKIERNQEDIKKSYEDFMDEKLSKEEFLKAKKRCENENQKYQYELLELDREEQQKQELIKVKEEFLNHLQYQKLTAEQLTREVLVELIDQIYIFPDQTIDVYFKFISEEK